MRRTVIRLAVTALAVVSASAVAQTSSSSHYGELDWLVGEWRADFELPRSGGARPTMTWSWGGPSRDFLRHRGTRPGPEVGLVPEYESVVAWHPTRSELLFLTVYLGDAGKVVGDGTIEVLEDGAVRLHMSVHYPPGVRLPFSGEAVAGPGGHTLQFRRTFRRDGDDRLRGFFVIRRGDRWENPHPEMTTLEEGFSWTRVEGREP